MGIRIGYLSDEEFLGGDSAAGGSGSLLSDDDFMGDDAPPQRATMAQSFGRGVDQMQGMLYGGVEAIGEAVGSEGVTEFGREGRERNVEEAAQYPARQSFLDIGGAGDAGQFAKDVIAEQAPIFGPTVAGAVAGGAIGSVVPVVGTTVGALLGAALPTFLMGSGEVQGAIKEKDPDAVAPGYALGGGAAIAALDTLLPGKMGSRIARSFGFDAAEIVAKQVLLKRIPAEAGKAAVTEGLTEGLQEVIAEATAAQATGQELSEDWWKNAVEGAAAGALMGGAVGGASVAGTSAEAAEGVPEGAAPADEFFGTEADPETDRPDSPRLTPEDRASPLPNDLIDDGKKIFEEALGGKGGMAEVDEQVAADIEMDVAAESSMLSPQAAAPAREEALGGPATAAEPASAPVVTPAGLLPDHEFLSDGDTNPEPTPGQAEAGNYQKRHVKVHGLDVSIETEKDGIRRSKPGAAEPWEVTMPAAYGDIKRTTGADGDNVDVYLGPQPSDKVYVIDQIDADTLAFDEHKILIDFPSRDAALAAYEQAFSDERGGERVGAVTEMPVFGFKSWLKSGDTTQPLSYGGPAQPQARPKLSLDEMVQRVRAKSAALDKQVAELVAADKPVRMKSDRLTALVGPDMSEPGKFRITTFDDRGPMGHMVHNTFEDAIRGALQSNFKPVEEPAAAPKTEPAPIKQRGARGVKIPDIVQFLAANGGISDYKGELGSLDLKRHMVPGIGKLVRDSGMPLDRAREIAEEAGYIGKAGEYQITTVADLLDAIDRNVRGDRVYSREDAGRAANREAEKSAVTDSEEQARRDDFDQTVKEFDLNEDETAEIEAAVERGEWASEAIVDILERRAIAEEDETRENSAEKEPDFDAPFDTGPAESSGEEASDAVDVRQGPDEREEARAAPRGGEPAEAERAGRPPEGREGEGELSAEDSALLADLPEGYRFIEGKGQLGRGQWGVASPDKPNSLVWGLNPTKAAAVREAKQRLANVDANQRERAAQTEREQAIAKRLLAGEEATDADLRTLDLKISSQFEYLSPTVQRLFGIGNRKVREAMGDALKEIDTGLGSGTTMWVAPAKKALRNAAAWVNAQQDPKTETVDTEDGKREQAVIPGAERISQKAQAEREADKPMRPKVPQKDAGELFDTQARSERQDELFALRREGPRQQGIPASAVTIAPFTSDADIKAHPDYRAAKAGDQKAAERMVSDLVPDSSLQQAVGSFGTDVIYAPVIAHEASGHNAIPWTMADYYAVRTGAKSTTDIHQTNRAFHTGAKAMERLAVRATFGGPVVSGGRYVIVDDVTVMGSTLADMADHIQRNGGEVVGTVTLANASRTGVLIAARHRISAIERRFGDVVRSELHLDPASLTGPEAEYVLNFRDADALRDRIAASLRERGERLGSKGIREPAEDQGEGEGRLKLAEGPQPTDAFKDQSQAIGKRLRAELDRIGLKDIGLRIQEKIEAFIGGEMRSADGVYFQKLITVALDADNPDAVLDHEALHALRDVGALNPEWPILDRMSGKKWMFQYEIDKAYAGFPYWVQIEEGVAHAYADWRNGARMDGIITKAFKKIRSVLQAIARAFGKDFRTAEDVFEQQAEEVFARIASGEIGARRDVAANPVDARKEPFFQAAWHGGSRVIGLRILKPSESVSGKWVVGQAPNGPNQYFDNETDARATYDKIRADQSYNYVIYDDSRIQIAERFKLRSAPHTAQQSQQAMQGFIARGQPIDRAIRLPFDILGGLDDQGRWNPGKRVTEKVTDVLVRKSFDPNGRFRFLHGVVENARRGLVDRYGLTKEYIEADRRRAQHERGVLQQASDVLKVLSNAGVGTNEAKVLQAILTGEAVNDADMTRLAVPIRQAIDDLGAEAVSLGLISAESFERNRGSYLHRVYQKNEIDQGTLAGFVSRQMASRRKRIIGDEMKGRGMFWDVPVERLMRDIPAFQEGQSGTPNVGDKFRVIDEVSASGDMLAGEDRAKTLRRVYWPASDPVPDKYTGPNWKDRGEWEVRKAGKKPTLWRDYTKPEREKMGEIVDARYTIGKTFMLLANDLATGRFFKEVAENEAWAQTGQPPAEMTRTAEEYNRFWNDPEVQWVHVPDTAISNTGGKKRWGALAGKYVRAEIWRDLKELEVQVTPGPWRKLLRQWKMNKTSRSPVVHMNNIMSNMMFMDLADVRAQDLIAGLRAYVKGGKDFEEARDAGAFGADMMSQEIRDNVLKPLLEEIAREQQGGTANTFLANAGVLGKLADRLWTWAKAADNGMIRAYQAEDEIFRMATYMRRRSQGESPETAAANARDQFLNYDIRAPWINAARNTVFPFISYTYRAIPKLAENLAHRPWKMAKYMTIAYAANALAYLWDDGDDGEEREREALRDQEQGYTWLGTPRMLRMPWRDEGGLPVFLDVRRWVPAGDIFDTNQGSSALPIPAPLNFGGPIMLAAEFMLNRQAFTGKDISNDLTDDLSDKAGNVADWAWKSWAPGAFWIPQSWYWTKISNALYGATDAAGRAYSVPQAFLNSVGIKVRPLDVEDGLKWRAYDFKKVNQALRAAARSLGRQRERGLISQKAFDSGMAKLTEKFGNLEADYEDFAERSQKKNR